MEFVCNKSDLLYGIQTVQKAVPAKSTLDVLTGILIETIDSNTVKLTGNDLEIGIESNIASNVKKEGSVVISSNIFGDLIRKLPDTDIMFSTSDDNKAIIKCGKSEYKISCFDPEDYPSLPELKKENIIELPQSTFKEMIRKTNYAVSEDMSKTVLTGQLLEIIDNEIKIVSLDGFRIAFKKEKIENNASTNIKIVIPGKTMNEFSKILSDNGSFYISLTDNQVLFDLGNTRVISRIIDGDYINYEKIIPVDFKTKVEIDKSQLIDSIDRAYILAKEDQGNNLVKILINEDEVLIKSNSEMGNVNENLEAKTNGENLEIAFNSRYLIEALKSLDNDKVIIEFIDQINPCLIRPDEDNSQLNIVLPVRVL